MGATPGLKLPIPELTETADGPDAFSDLGLAVEGYVLDRTLPAGVTRAPIHHWGSGTAFPTGASVRTGDTYRHTGLGCLMAYNSSAWRQTEMPVVADAAARTAISTTYSALLHVGFRVRQSDLSITWEWTGTEWGAISPISGKAWRTAGNSSAMGMGGSNQVTFDASRVRGGVTVAGAPSVFTLSVDGLYRVRFRGYYSGPAANTCLTWITRDRAGASQVVLCSADGWKGNANDCQPCGGDVVPLKAGDTIKMWQNPTASSQVTYWGTAEGSGIFLSVEYVGPLNGATPL